MAELRDWQHLPVAGAVRPEEAARPLTGGWRTGERPAVDVSQVRELPALLVLLPRLGDRPRRRDVHRLRPRLLQGLRDLRGGLPGRRDRDGAGMTDVRLLTGGEAVAHAMRQIDPDVVPVYPITPQTPIIQTFAKFVADGAAQTEIVNVESEHSAMSAAIGAALAGARTMTATSSQGLALMAEIVYIAASMRAPIVMALGNRALSGPINIHCDHSDSMLIRDSGVIQLFAENAQEAYDLTVIAPRLAEHPDVLLPVLVCQDGFTITHSAEPVTLLPDAAVRHFVGDYSIPHAVLDVARPTTQGPFAMPDYYYEFRRQQAAAIEAVGDRVRRARRPSSRCLSGRNYGEIEEYRLEGAADGDRRPRLDGGNGQGRRRRAARGGRARRPAQAHLVPPVPRRGDRGRPAATSTPSSSSTAPTRPAPRRRSTPRWRPRSTAAAASSAAPSTASAGATCTPPTSAPSSPARPRPTSACEVTHVASEDTRAEPEGRPAAARGTLPLPGLRRADGRPDRPQHDQTARRRRQRDRLPRGRDDALPDHRVERALAARRVRERGRGRERRRERPARACAGGTRCRPTRTSRSSSSRGTEERTTSACRRSPALSSEAIASSSSATTTRPT